MNATLTTTMNTASVSYGNLFYNDLISTISNGIELFGRRNSQSGFENKSSLLGAKYISPVAPLTTSLLTEKLGLDEYDFQDVIKKSVVISIGKKAPSIFERLNFLSDVKYGWDGDNAKPMSLVSLMELKRFFEKFGDFSKEIGVFLGYDGEIIINWLSEEAGLVDVSFLNGYVSVVSDDDEYERSFEVALDHLKEII
jgi:hypothetical protein